MKNIGKKERKGSFGLRWFGGKSLVAALRGGNYAHAGEEDAIELALQHVNKNRAMSILDVGCGQGGTAKYIYEQGWGKEIVGIDIEKESINYAKELYPEIEFYATDVLNAKNILGDKKFDIICLFNSFYAFHDQLAALNVLRQCAKDDGQLIIFEYTDLCKSNAENPLLDTQNKTAVTIPVRKEALISMLSESGWKLDHFVDLTTEYTQWYDNLLQKLVVKREKIIKNFGQEAYQKAIARYTGIHNALVNGDIGGGTFYIKTGMTMTKIPDNSSNKMT